MATETLTGTINVYEGIYQKTLTLDEYTVIEHRAHKLMQYFDINGKETKDRQLYTEEPRKAHEDTYHSTSGQDVLEEDFVAYIGKNANKYISKFKKFNISGIDNFAATWHWPAFFVGPLWMLYRKLYLYFIIFSLISLIPFFGIISWIVAAIIANYIYYKQAKTKILAVKSSPSVVDIPTTLSQIGGVNSWVWVVGIIIFILFVVTGIIKS